MKKKKITKQSELMKYDNLTSDQNAGERKASDFLTFKCKSIRIMLLEASCQCSYF